MQILHDYNTNLFFMKNMCLRDKLEYKIFVVNTDYQKIIIVDSGDWSSGMYVEFWSNVVSTKQDHGGGVGSVVAGPSVAFCVWKVEWD